MISDPPVPPLFGFRRVFVALDHSAKGRAALKVAVSIALETRAELQGLFVENEDLLRLAALPFAREVEFASATSRELQSPNMERALRVAADKAQRQFSHALARLNLKWTFRTVRGSIIQASLAAAGDDLLVIGQRGCSPRVLASESLPIRAAATSRVVVLLDGNGSALRAIELACPLAHPAPIRILVLAKNGDAATRECRKWLEENHVSAEVVVVDRDQIVDFLRQRPPAILLMNREADFFSNQQISWLLNDFECPLILC